MIDRINVLITLPRTIIVYWAGFWLLNGLDKFLNRTQIGVFTWHGKDRKEQFGNYFANCNFPEHWITPLLHGIGIWEIFISIPLWLAAWFHNKNEFTFTKWYSFGMTMGAITFVLFSMGDVILGDRAELLEHGTYLILVCVSYQYLKVKDWA
ncbi:hypothetical protein [Veronia pacifica]|uniref:DoxX family protein n=1 Tax=Veronia pacifica TaxID=1080227 RepID=A0A1C3ECF0_9GAMM|nr:hypothetical protein [Veronia pacifica]ODA30919.1 hypothetical protein A8L45_18775 [Veronia pacifica]